ncbi:hypothetical protein OAJ27_01915 [bacterium]|nr:hypothetical protein [bacterium]
MSIHKYNWRYKMQRDNLILLATLLGYGVIIGFGILVYSLVMVWLFPGFAYAVTSFIFPISEVDYHVLYLTCIGVFKMLWLLFFVIPYCSINLYLNK